MDETREGLGDWGEAAALLRAHLADERDGRDAPLALPGADRSGTAPLSSPLAGLFADRAPRPAVEGDQPPALPPAAPAPLEPLRLPTGGAGLPTVPPPAAPEQRLGEQPPLRVEPLPPLPASVREFFQAPPLRGATSTPLTLPAAQAPTLAQPTPERSAPTVQAEADRPLGVPVITQPESAPLRFPSPASPGLAEAVAPPGGERNREAADDRLLRFPDQRPPDALPGLRLPTGGGPESTFSTPLRMPEGGAASIPGAEGGAAPGGKGGEDLVAAVRELRDAVRELRDASGGAGGGREPGPQADGSFVPSGPGGMMAGLSSIFGSPFKGPWGG
jgi:hypothetical protein